MEAKVDQLLVSIDLLILCSTLAMRSGSTGISIDARDSLPAAIALRSLAEMA